MRDGNKPERDRLSVITRELQAMSDWELERGCAASLGFDDDRRMVADRLLRERYAGPEAGVALWIMAIAAGVGLFALLE